MAKQRATFIKDLKRKAPKKGEFYDQYIDYIADEDFALEKSEHISYQLAIIGLSISLEIVMRNIIIHRFKPNKNIIDSLFKFKELIKFLTSKQIFISGIQNYKEYNELRCINNCLKHSGIVDKQLTSANSKWHLEKSFDGGQLKDAYERLKNPACLFIKLLVKEIK
jgi:hypothetical protein